MNDNVELGVNVSKEFNSLLTQDEEEKQFLLQVVGKYCKDIPTQIIKKSVNDAVSKKLINNSYKL